MTPGMVVVVHPDDVNLADAKALAARHDATVIGDPHMPRHQIFLINPGALTLPGLEQP